MKLALTVAQAIYLSRTEKEAIEVDRLKHFIAEKLAAWEAALRESGIHVDPVTGAVTLQR